MYWFYAAPGWGLVLWLLSMLLVTAGGWLVATHLFSLESRERVLVGLGIGLVSYLWIVNWIGRVLPALLDIPPRGAAGPGSGPGCGLPIPQALA